jgi:hypothetical protein
MRVTRHDVSGMLPGGQQGLVNVRFAPKATECCLAAKRRYVPNSRHRRLPLANKKAPNDAGT